MEQTGLAVSNKLKQLDDELIYIHGVLAKNNIVQRQTNERTHTTDLPMDN